MSAPVLSIRRHLALRLLLRVLSPVTSSTFSATHVSELHNSLFYTHTLYCPAGLQAASLCLFLGWWPQSMTFINMFQFLGIHLRLSQVSLEAAWNWSGGFPFPQVLGASKMISLVGNISQTCFQLATSACPCWKHGKYFLIWIIRSDKSQSKTYKNQRPPKLGPSGVHTSQLEHAEPLVVYPSMPLSLPVLVLVLPLSSCSWAQWFAPSLFWGLQQHMETWFALFWFYKGFFFLDARQKMESCLF